MTKVRCAGPAKWAVLGALLCVAAQLPAQSGQDNDCLGQSIAVPYTPPDAGDKARSAGKSVLGSILSGATGGAVSTRGGEEPELARRPRYDKSRLEFADSDIELEYQGALDDGAVRMAVRVRKDRDKGGPHLIALQDIHCRVLLPESVEVFELWGKGGLSVSWSSSTYQDGSLVSTDSGAFDTDWATLSGRYPSTSDIPGIWQSYQQPPFEGIRGVTATFQPPPGETFDPAEWYLVTHITSPLTVANTVSTEPFVTQAQPGKKDEYAFAPAQNVNWQPPAVSASVLAMQAPTGLVCKDDCKKLLEEIDRIRCEREDCSDERAAVDAALEALEDAKAVLERARSDLAQANQAIHPAMRKVDEARADRDRARRKLDIESEKQNRLIESLRRGGHGISAQQLSRAIQFAKDFLEHLNEAVAEAEQRLEQAEEALAGALGVQTAALDAVEEARDSVLGAEEALALAQVALSDCMQRDWERCQAIDELWEEYGNCRSRCREQDRVREDVDRASGFVEEGKAEMAEDVADYDESVASLDEAKRGLRDLGATSTSNASELAREAAEKRREAEQLHRDAEGRLKDAENRHARGDLDGARESAESARDLQEQAEEAMDDAADLMESAEGEARRQWQKELRERLERQDRALAEAARKAALKKQACMVHIGQYFSQQGGNASLLEELGDFVGGEGKDALDQARDFEYSPEKVKEFLDKVEAYREQLEKILTLINGIGENASIEARNEAFGTALGIAGEISQRIPGLGEFFNFYSSAYNAAIGALYALQEEMIGRYKPMADDFIRAGGNCCSYTAERLENVSLEDIVNERWERFRTDNSAALSRLSGDSMRKLEDYFKSRLTVKWATCCLDFVLDG